MGGERERYIYRERERNRERKRERERASKRTIITWSSLWRGSITETICFLFFLSRLSGSETNHCVLLSPPGKRFAYDGDRPTDSCTACAITDEAMDMVSASGVQNILPRSAAIATGNQSGKSQAFPGTQNRPPHLQMM